MYMQKESISLDFSVQSGDLDMQVAVAQKDLHKLFITILCLEHWLLFYMYYEHYDCEKISCVKQYIISLVYLGRHFPQKLLSLKIKNPLLKFHKE